MDKKDIIITSRQNPRVKKLCALSDKKAREEASLFRFDGIKLFLEAVDCGIALDSVYIKESSADSISVQVADKLNLLSNDKIVYLSDEVFDKVSEEKSPQGIITVAKYIDKFVKLDKIEYVEFPEKEESVLLVESVRDPGNLGTMIRSAVALGVDKIILSSDCADIYNPKTIRAAMGALFRTDIIMVVGALMPEYISGLRGCGRRVFAAALDDGASVLGEFESLRGDCFVIGNEGHGLSHEVISACTGSVIIPMRAGCESLNAAAASVIFMWEMYKANK